MKMYDVIKEEVMTVIGDMELPKTATPEEFEELLDQAEEMLFDYADKIYEDEITELLANIEDYTIVEIAQRIKEDSGLSFDQMNSMSTVYNAMIMGFNMELDVVRKELSKIVDVTIN